MKAQHLHRFTLLMGFVVGVLGGCSSVPEQTDAEELQSATSEDLEVEENSAELAGINALPDGEELEDANFLSEPEEVENFLLDDDSTGQENMFADSLEESSPEENPAELPSNTSAGLDGLAEEQAELGVPLEGGSAFDELMAADPVDPIAAAAAEAASAFGPLTPDSTDSASTDVNPVGIGSAMTPPSFQGSVGVSPDGSIAPGADAGVGTPELVDPSMGSAPSAASEVTAAASEAETIDASLASLRWIGYRIREAERDLRVEILTRGSPEFEIYEETNRAQQIELVIRFYQTKLRRKIRWPVDSSEFRSPVAFVRMREFADKGVVDVILTHRDPLLPQFYSKDGQILLVYKIPDRYFDASKPVARQVIERASSLVANQPTPLAPSVQVRNEGRKLGYARPELFPNVKDQLRPIRAFIRSQRRQDVDAQGLPASFDRQTREEPSRLRTSWITKRKTFVGVAQDDLDTEEPSNAEFENAAAEPLANGDLAEPDGSLGNAVNTDADAFETNSLPVETVNPPSSELNVLPNEAVLNATPSTEGTVLPASDAALPAEAVPGSNLPAETTPFANPIPETMENLPAETETEPMSNISVPDDSLPAAAPAPSPDSEASDVMGQAQPAEASPQYGGKPIFMEFYEAPLSLVLKSFSEETGNNFIYPATIGQTPVTVHFKGVPWDEALKAILETYSLGMVRIGQNVVRIDQIINLTQYLQALEQAREFETRRLPTKVLIFRLNNAVANDVTERLRELLARDMELDARIKATPDERTNSVVMEAPAHVLTKAKSIVERLDLETPQVEIASRIVEVQKTQNNFFGIAWGNNFSFDPGRALGFGTLNFPNSLGSSFAVDPGVQGETAAGTGRFRIGSLNKFVDLDLLLRMEEKKGSTNVLQSNRVLVLDGQEANILAGSSRFFRPAAGGNVINPAPGAGGGGEGLSEVKFNLELRVTPQVTALGSVIMNLSITSDTPGDPTGEALAEKNTRKLDTQMVRMSGDTGVIGGIYDTVRTAAVTGVPILSDIPILGALFRSSRKTETQTELLIMVTPTIVSGQSREGDELTEMTKQPQKDKQAKSPQPTKQRDPSIF